MSPPLASERDRRALIEALRDGTIDCVATDHAPHAREEKDVPFEAAANGTTGLETAFPALYRGPRRARPARPRDARHAHDERPGPRLRPARRPRIAVGEPANLALWDLDERYVVCESDLRSRSRNYAFLGREVAGRCRLTLAGGPGRPPARARWPRDGGAPSTSRTASCSRRRASARRPAPSARRSSRRA